jgi:hypothetical protein
MTSSLEVIEVQEPPGETLAIMSLACSRHDEAVAVKVINVVTMTLTAPSKEEKARFKPVSPKKITALASTVENNVR